MRLTGDADIAGDVVQDVWLRAVRGLPRLRDAGSFGPGFSALPVVY